VSDLFGIPAFSEAGDVHVVVETIRGSRAKFKYDPDTKAFLFSRSLRLGLAYPYDWGFIPSTMAEDGDPLDGLVLNEFATFPGALIRWKRRHQAPRLKLLFTGIAISFRCFLFVPEIPSR
jgi:inorganic pyrophosphatase